jgi:hypothetical protein
MDIDEEFSVDSSVTGETVKYLDLTLNSGSDPGELVPHKPTIVIDND